MGVKTLFVMQDAHANALATNKDASQIVIAGRNIFKIFSIEEDEIVEKMNLRVGKNISLNYSTGDVVWSHHEDTLLATAATNGSVVTWRLDKNSISKQDTVFHDHRRTVHKVNFHPAEAHLLLSGSQDGTMKLFDLRKKEVVSTFYSNAESVRDVEFSPFQHYTFAAVQENGNVQLWDLRRADRCEKHFTGHSGPVFSCNWHPEERRWIATAGRDKTIKVWDVQSPKFSPEHTIHTIASVTHVKWRPHRRHHIASTSLVVDFTINVWDLRRPYIPYAVFNEHKDVTTAITWRNDPGILLSTSKDNSLYQHTFKDAVRPAEKANPAGVDINCSGDVCMAMSKKLILDAPVGKDSYSMTKFPAIFRKMPNPCDQQFRPTFSSLQICSNAGDHHLSTEWFLKSAKTYQLKGHSISDICEHNAAVAKSLNRHQEATSWNILKLLYTRNVAGSTHDVNRQPSLELGRPTLESEKNLQAPDSHHFFDGPSADQRSSRHQSGSNHRHHSGGGKSEDRQQGDTSTGLSEDETETDDTDFEGTLGYIASGMAYHPEFGGGDNDFGQFPYMFEMENRILNLDEKMALVNWQLPTEAFEQRIDLTDPSPLPDHNVDIFRQGDDNNDDFIDVISGINDSSNRSEGEDEVPALDIDSFYQSMPEWDFTSVVVDMLHFYASQGDVQMSVSVLIVLGEQIKNCIDEHVQEEWYQVYIELLSRFQLFPIANEVIKLCPLRSISSMNQQSTSIHTNCGCGHPLGRLEWVCERCKSCSNICSVCHQLVKGLYVWCQGCSHGGHLQHCLTWLEKNRRCPAGCGHFCEFT